MGSDVLLILAAAAFMTLLFAGRRELVESAGAKVANGVLMLVLATLAGVIIIELLASCGSPRIVEGSVMRLPRRGPLCWSRS